VWDQELRALVSIEFGDRLDNRIRQFEVEDREVLFHREGEKASEETISPRWLAKHLRGRVLPTFSAAIEDNDRGRRYLAPGRSVTRLRDAMKAKMHAGVLGRGAPRSG
jgi:hypothetical protein